MSHTLVLATSNPGKVKEFERLWTNLPLSLVSSKALLKKDVVVIEDGETFAENAVKKANALAAKTMMLTVADDSGLEVDALGGAPGVRSARYAGEEASAADNNRALLEALSSKKPDHKDGFRARFRCVLALVDPLIRDGEPTVVEGACEGRIVVSARGDGGFGYDPLFVVDGMERTMAELTHDEKNAHSHRGKAAARLALVLEKNLAARDEITRRVLG